MVGLDVTTRVRLTDDGLERMAARDAKVGGFMYRIATSFIARAAPHDHCKSCDETFLTVRSAEEAGYHAAGDCLRP